MVTAKAHGGQIDIEGVTVALVNDELRVQKLETWFDPLEMFRQIAPNGVVNKSAVKSESVPAPEAPSIESLTVDPEKAAEETKAATPVHDAATKDVVNASEHSIVEKQQAMEEPDRAKPENALAVPSEAKQTAMTHEEMSKIMQKECPFLNGE